MPTYEFECRNRRCSHKWDDFRRIKDRDEHAPCPICGTESERMVTFPAHVEGDIADWSNENNGKGRYCPQAARFPKDPKGYMKSRQKLIDHAKSKGLTASRD
jgi:putative FmdB family regulatory protein